MAHQTSSQQDQGNSGSHITFWEGDIEKTSFDQVIFSPCGGVFRKGVGWDGKSSWMIFDRKDGIFQWVLTEGSPFSEADFGYEMAAPMMNINSLWWNFKMGEFVWTEKNHGEETQEEEDKIYAQIKIFSGPWNGSWSRVPYQWNLVWDGKGVEVESEGFQGNYIPDAVLDGDYEYYNNSYSLKELPIYDGGNKTWEDHEGWTHCLEEPDWVENMLSYESSDDENGESTTEKREIKEEVEDKVEDEVKDEVKEEVKEELREDPFDGDLYTKKEFVDYYGTTLQWDFMSEEKTFKRGILGKWILENGSYMRPEATNYLLDKMIETFL